MEGKQCIFPFNYEGQTYNQCSREDFHVTMAWCATMVDDNEELVKDQWGVCGDKCPKNGKINLFFYISPVEEKHKKNLPLK